MSMKLVSFETAVPFHDNDDADPHPLRYADIHAVLRQELSEGVYAVGCRFPSDAELQSRFQVGRHTVREALKALADEGYISRLRRRGTFVLATTLQARYVQFLGTLHDLVDFGVETRLDVQSFGITRLRDAQMCDWLKLPSGQRWLHITGVRKHHETGQPVCWSEFFLPPQYAFKKSQLDGRQRTIHELVARLHGFDIDYIDQEFGATALPGSMAEPLQAAADSAAMLVVRRYHRPAVAQNRHGLDTLVQATLNVFPAGRYWVRGKVERDRSGSPTSF